MGQKDSYSRELRLAARVMDKALEGFLAETIPLLRKRKLYEICMSSRELLGVFGEEEPPTEEEFKGNSDTMTKLIKGLGSLVDYGYGVPIDEDKIREGYLEVITHVKDVRTMLQSVSRNR